MAQTHSTVQPTYTAQPMYEQVNYAGQTYSALQAYSAPKTFSSQPITPTGMAAMPGTTMSTNQRKLSTRKKVETDPNEQVDVDKLDPRDQVIADTLKQWKQCNDNKDLMADVAASKRSPFKFDSADHLGEMNLGISAVALPNLNTDFGKRYLEVIDRVQRLHWEYLPNACKPQTVAHMSVGSVILDKKTPGLYNEAVMHRVGMLAKVKAYLDALNPPIRAKIQTLKINPDGCVTFQLEEDPAQSVMLPEAEFEAALLKVPTCRGKQAAAAERKKFKQNQDGSYTVSRFQQVRLVLGGLGCEIKGMYSAGHMVVMNLVDPKATVLVPQEKVGELYKKCYNEWSPLKGIWFELSQVVCLCYVERSLNEGSVVMAPSPGTLPQAFPPGRRAAQALLGGIFTATVNGDVLIDHEKFDARRADRGGSTWKSFRGELRKMSSSSMQPSDRTPENLERDLREAFRLFDADNSGSVSVAELGLLMKKLGENLTDEQLCEMANRADISGDGQVEFEEFKKVLFEE